MQFGEVGLQDQGAHLMAVRASDSAGHQQPTPSLIKALIQFPGSQLAGNATATRIHRQHGPVGSEDLGLHDVGALPKGLQELGSRGRVLEGDHGRGVVGQQDPETPQILPGGPTRILDQEQEEERPGDKNAQPCGPQEDREGSVSDGGFGRGEHDHGSGTPLGRNKDSGHLQHLGPDGEALLFEGPLVEAEPQVGPLDQEVHHDPLGSQLVAFGHGENGP